MKKNDIARLPEGLNSVMVGLGWECPARFGDIDLDASIICLDSEKNVVQTCMFNKLRVPGISHRGDNTTGEGAGDDERIRIDMNKLPAKVTECHIVVNIYSNGIKFSNVDDAFVRLCVA